MNHRQLIHRFVLAGLLGGSVAAQAGYQVHQSGPMLTLGKTSHPSSILGISYNPAAGQVLIGEEESIRMGYFSSLGAQVEFGEADNFLEEVDDLKDALEQDITDIQTALDIKARFDDLLPVLGEDARLTVMTDLHLPLLPVAVKSEALGGVISFGVQTGGIFDMRFLDDPISINNSGGGIELETDSAVYVKGATVTSASLGYSRDIYRPEFLPSAQVFGGIQANVYRASLNKQVLSIQNIIDDDEDNSIGDAARDEFEENTVDTTQVGIDIGFLMAMPNGQVGITFANINEPEFDYGDIGVNCGAIVDPIRQSNCNIAQQVFSDRIDLTETAVMNAQTTIEGAVFTKDKSLLLAGSADVNSTYDLVGRETQFINASASYFSDSYWLPSVRLSVSQNLKGSELTTIGLGTTLFGVMNLDFAGSLDKIEVDGSSLPRHMGFNIGFEEKF